MKGFWVIPIRPTIGHSSNKLFLTLIILLNRLSAKNDLVNFSLHITCYDLTIKT